MRFLRLHRELRQASEDRQQEYQRIIDDMERLQAEIAESQARHRNALAEIDMQAKVDAVFHGDGAA